MKNQKPTIAPVAPGKGKNKESLPNVVIPKPTAPSPVKPAKGK
jgi:hypothetical protein